MKRLIITTTDSVGASLCRTGLANHFNFNFFTMRLVSWERPSVKGLEAWLSPRSAEHKSWGSHWLDRAGKFEEGQASEDGLVEMCERFDAVAFWVDPDPNSQLILIWLLDYLRRHMRGPLNLDLLQADVRIGDHTPDELTKWQLPSIKVQQEHLEAAGKAWQAYFQPTPQAWFNLLSTDLRLLPQLRTSVLELLEELPMVTTGLGATEMRMLELIAAGNATPFDVFPGHEKPNERRVYDYWETGQLLDGIACHPAPAVTGLKEGPFTLEMHENSDRYVRYKASQLKLTPLGKAILSGTDDFSRHNPVHRWWGGTELTNDQLWRWDSANRILIAP